MFCLAAPVTAIFVFMCLEILPLENSSDSSMLGLCLLFSAGTFVYSIASHIMPELQPHGNQPMSKPNLFAMSVGMLSPLVLSIDHSH